MAEEQAEHGRRRLEKGRAFDAEAFFTVAATWFGLAREWERKARTQAFAATAIEALGDADDGAIVCHLWYTGDRRLWDSV